MKAVRGHKTLLRGQKRHEGVDLLKNCLIKVAQQPHFFLFSFNLCIFDQFRFRVHSSVSNDFQINLIEKDE